MLLTGASLWVPVGFLSDLPLRTVVIRWRVHSDTRIFSLESLTPAKTLFPNKAPFSEFRGGEHLLGVR